MAEQPKADPTSPGFVPVCAIGASAGGVGALQTLFRLLPDDLGLAYVVVVHLSPDHPSAMHEIIGACTKMSVLQVNDGPTLRPNCVYVIAPDSELVIEGDHVQSRPFSDPRSRRAPIDMFFRSIASGRGDVIAVVLTGAGSDGALGVRAIKEAGGIVMVQEPAEAGFPSMPQNAIATGVADVVAPIARLAERIADAARSKEAVRSLDDEGAANDVRRIIAFLRIRTGHDFSGYKRSTVLRRIQRRMQVRLIADLDGYAQHLRSTPEEAKELLSDLLISVTMFFRDPATFITLSRRVIRPLLERRSAGETEEELRAWVVGCATGEEAYSLAILLLEEAELLKVKVPIQIFATDLDEGALATAREGRYPRSIEADVSTERLTRFFVDEGTHYRIDRKVRDLVLFATHSVVREPPFMRLDLITCRNVLIYLERALQQHVNSIFRYGLNPGGYLFLGTAETADTSDNHFAVVDREARIYRALPSRPEFVPNLATPSAWSAGRPALTESRLAIARLDVGEVLGESHAAALEASAPPSALVDAGQSVLHLSPSAGRFILLSAGPLSGRLPTIVRPELRLDLKLALDRAFEARRPTTTRLIDVAMEGDTRRLSLHVSPLPTGDGAAARAIVYFLDSGPGRTENADALASPPEELRRLHSELKVAQEAELAGRIRHESAVQELRASNEELQSLNEEYRSTAEELETSKEELQSINEELQTVNAELKSKFGVISAAHNDLQNLTASSEIGTLFLDLDLRIRMFTPRVAELINVADADVGRPITNFTHWLEYEDIATDIRRVLRDQTPSEKEVRTIAGRWFTVRVRPYRTIEGKVEGVVATFDDITVRKEAEKVLAEEFRNTAILQDLSARLVTEESVHAIYDDILTAAIKITRAKAGTVQMLDAGADELVGLSTRGFSKRTEDYFHRLDARSNTSCGLALRSGARSYLNFNPASTDVATRMHVGDGVLSAQSSPLVSRLGKPIGMVSTHWGELDHRPSERELRFLDLLVRQAADLIEQRQVAAALRESEKRYHSLFAASPAPFLILKPDAPRFTITDVNEGYLAATMRTREDVVGRGVFEAYPDNPDATVTSVATLRSSLERVLASKRPNALPDFKYDMARPDGAFEERWWSPISSPVLNKSGEVEAIIHNATDVSEEHRAEAALRESERRIREREADLARVQRIGGVGGLDIDVAAGLTSRSSPELSRLHGLPPDTPDETHEDWRARIHPDDVDEADRRLFSALQSDAQSYESEYRIIRPNDGAVRWIVARADIERCADGQALRLVGAHIDITDQKRMQEALRESEERIRGFGEASQDVLWIRDATTMDWIYLTPAFKEVYGLSREEALRGENFNNWLMLIIPEDRAHAHAKIDRVLAGELVSFEYRIRRPQDGEIRWLRDTDFPIRDEHGRIASFGGICQDITAIKAAEERLTTSEERLRSAAEVAKFALWDWNLETGQVAWSDEHFRMEGHAVGEVTPSYELWAARVHPDDLAETEAAMACARDTHTEYAREFRSLYPDGSVHWHSARGRFFYDKTGAPVRMIGAMLDTTERREWEERQKVLVAELQHRTFNLMGLVRSTADATIRSSANLNEFKLKFRDRIAALARVQRLLSRLKEDDRIAFDVLIRGELEAVGALQGDDGQVTLDGPEGVALRSSTVQIFAMAIHELTTNAVKYGALTQPGARLDVRWRLERGEKDQPWLHVDWRETGLKMPAADAPPRGTGQGRILIEQALPYQLQAKTTYDMTEDSVRCSIALPVSARTHGEADLGAL